jgi:colanic acid/amylovoran biosynthesis glycosyltransferase
VLAEDVKQNEDAARQPRVSEPVAYVVGFYPALSQPFVQTEVDALRALGVQVETISIRKADGEHVLSTTNRAAADTTYAILPPRWGDVFGAHLRALVRRPLRYLQTLVLAFRLSPPGIRGPVWQFFYFVEAIVAWRRCSLAGARHLHAHMANVATDVTLLAAHFGGWTWSFTLHGPFELWDVRRHRLAEKVRAADFVVCVSDFTRSQLMAQVDETEWPKIHVVHCGVDSGAFSRRTPYPAAGPILAVGRLVADKGFGVLLEALRLLADDGVDARLVLVGSGPKADALAAQAAALGVADRVTFAGAVSHDAIRDHYEHAAVFCSASFAEGIPVVLMEAMALEVPVVATRIAGVPELVEEGVSGRLVTPGRPDELADALAGLLRDRGARESLGRAGRDRVVEGFDPARSARQLLELFSETTG